MRKIHVRDDTKTAHHERNCPFEFGPNGKYFPIENTCIFESDRKNAFETNGNTLIAKIYLISNSNLTENPFEMHGNIFITNTYSISDSKFDRTIFSK